MATYKNISKGAHVHAGKVCAPLGTFDAEETPNLQKLVKADVLEVSAKAVPAKAEADKDVLIAALEKANVEHDKRWGVDKLQAALDASKKG